MSFDYKEYLKLVKSIEVFYRSSQDYLLKQEAKRAARQDLLFTSVTNPELVVYEEEIKKNV